MKLSAQLLWFLSVVFLGIPIFYLLGCSYVDTLERSDGFSYPTICIQYVGLIFSFFTSQLGLLYCYGIVSFHTTHLPPPPPFIMCLYVADMMRRVLDSHRHSSQLENCDLDPVYDALNSVSSCPWIINKKV